jgi:4-hydroxy-tetrahydrodipicolinate reductase
MGQVITKLAEEDTDVEIVAGVDPFDDGHNSYPVFSSIEKCDVDADVVIDLLHSKQASGDCLHNRFKRSTAYKNPRSV